MKARAPGPQVATTTTDALGYFHLPVLPGGEYVETFVVPQGSIYRSGWTIGEARGDGLGAKPASVVDTGRSRCQSTSVLFPNLFMSWPMRIRSTLPRLILVAALFFTAAVTASAQAAAPTSTSQKQIPQQLSDSAFWALISEFSENEQNFTAYMVSNETFYPNLVNRITALSLRGGAYIGVAPEQNYHYIAAIRPQIAFILDIRRQAVIQHLMFKAIFELSAQRADFISLLVTRPRPSGVSNSANAFDTWAAFWPIPTDTARYTPNRTRILDHLTKTHKFPFSSVDSSLLDYTYSRFYYAGPHLMANGTPGAEGNAATFANITSVKDAGMAERSFLANDDAYQAVRQLHLRNLIIPIVGDFAGVKALRSIGRYLTEHNVQLTAYYGSNVETYLVRDGKAQAWYANLALLPLSNKSVLINGISPGHVCNLQVWLTVGNCQ